MRCQVPSVPAGKEVLSTWRLSLYDGLGHGGFGVAPSQDGALPLPVYYQPGDPEQVSFLMWKMDIIPRTSWGQGVGGRSYEEQGETT